MPPPSALPLWATLMTSTPAIASAIDANAREPGFSFRNSHAKSATTAGIVLVMTPAATALVRATPFNISKVKPKVPKNACRKRLIHSPRATHFIFDGLSSGHSTTSAITKRKRAKSGTGTEATIDLPMPTLLPTSSMAAIRRKA